MAVSVVNCMVDGRSCYRSIASYSLRITIISYPSASDASVRGSLLEYCHDVWCGENYNGVAIRRLKNFEDTFCHFDRVHECDRQTDRNCMMA